MDAAILRILDANLNRAREGLRVMEDHARMVLNDARLAADIKQLRHDLAGVENTIGSQPLLASRDTPGDVGTAISTASEGVRCSAEAVAAASCKRVAEALRCVEEYAKIARAGSSSDDTTCMDGVAKRSETIRYRLYTVEQSLLVTAPRRCKLAETRLHVLLTEALCRRPWREVVSAVIDGGAGGVQLREKSMSDSALLERACELRELTRMRGVLLVINDRPDIARLCEADGVHLGRGDLPVSAARAIAGPTVLVGATAHDETEIREAVSVGADYIGVGPMFASATKPNVEIHGPSLLAMAMALSRDWPTVPIMAIGGVTANNVMKLRGDTLAGTGFSVAVCQGVIGQDDPADAARRILAGLVGTSIP